MDTLKIDTTKISHSDSEEQGGSLGLYAVGTLLATTTAFSFLSWRNAKKANNSSNATCEVIKQATINVVD